MENKSTEKRKNGYNREKYERRKRWKTKVQKRRKNGYNRKKYERQRKGFEENTKKEKEKEKEIKTESECIMLSKWKIQLWRQFFSCEEKDERERDQKKGEKN